MSIDNLIAQQVNDALSPLIGEIHHILNRNLKVEKYKSIQVPTSEVARILGKTPATIINYVDRGLLNPIDPLAKHKQFTLEELDNFKMHLR